MNILDIALVDHTEYLPIKATKTDAGYDLKAKIHKSSNIDKQILNTLILWSYDYVNVENTPDVYLNGEKLFEFNTYSQDDLDKLYKILDNDNYTVLSPAYFTDQYIATNIGVRRNMSAIDTGVRLNLLNLKKHNNKLPCALVLPRSGWAYKHQIGIVNSPGLIDTGYTGEIKVLLENRGYNFHIITDKTRIAQLVFLDVLNLQGCFISNVREEEGFGSSGVN